MHYHGRHYLEMFISEHISTRAVYLFIILGRDGNGEGRFGALLGCTQHQVVFGDTARGHHWGRHRAHKTECRHTERDLAVTPVCEDERDEDHGHGAEYGNNPAGLGW